MPLLLLAAASFACAAPRAKDGDDIICAGIDMRLAAIDAADHPKSRKCWPVPRRNAWCDAAAAATGKARLATLLASGPVDCAPSDANPFRAGFQPRDPYGRPVVRCSVNGRDIGTQLLAEGIVHRWP